MTLTEVETREQGPSGDRSESKGMDKVRHFEGLKFMWDGEEYAVQKDALDKRAAYEAEGFSVQMVADSDKHYLFTRRVVKDAAVS